MPLLSPEVHQELADELLFQPTNELENIFIFIFFFNGLLLLAKRPAPGFRRRKLCGDGKKK